MCLRLKSIFTLAKTAKEDIIVYKKLNIKRKTIINRMSELQNGDSFEGLIDGKKCKGRIFISRYNGIELLVIDENTNEIIERISFSNYFSFAHKPEISKIIINGEVVFNVAIDSYETPYRDFEVEIGETYTSKLIKKSYSVDVGLHSFEKLNDTIIGGYGEVIVKCIIPKGSRYYKGTFDGNISYASDTLTYLKIIY